jgi:hypothetical protein
MLVSLLVLSLSVITPDAEYAKVVEEAVKEFQAGRFVEARALFKRAHELQPSARTSRGIGMASFELSDYADAIPNLTAALTDRRKPLTAENRTQVEELLQRARSFSGHYRLDVVPSDAVLTLDGRPIGRELTLNAGVYSLQATREGHDPLTRTIEVKGGEDESIRVELPQIVVELPAPPPPPPPLEETSSALPIAMLTAGGVLAGATAGTAVWLVGRNREIGKCDDAGFNCFNGDDLRRQRTMALGFTIGAGVAALAAATTGVILFAAAPTEDGAAVTVGGSF